jgi:hypothetical protein
MGPRRSHFDGLNSYRPSEKGIAIQFTPPPQIAQALSQGGYAKELILSAAVAFLLGGFVYYRWQSGAAKWIWIVGVCGLMWLLVGSRGQTPFIPDWLRAWAVLSFVSLRLIAYSAGAWLSAKLIIGSATDLAPQESRESSPEGSDAP